MHTVRHTVSKTLLVTLGLLGFCVFGQPANAATSSSHKVTTHKKANTYHSTSRPTRASSARGRWTPEPRYRRHARHFRGSWCARHPYRCDGSSYRYRPYWHREWHAGYYDIFGFWHPGYWSRWWG